MKNQSEVTVTKKKLSRSKLNKNCAGLYEDKNICINKWRPLEALGEKTQYYKGDHFAASQSCPWQS